MDVRDLSAEELERMKGDVARELEARGSQDAPTGYGDRSNSRDRHARPTEIQGVLFQVRVPVGRRGETMPAYLLFPPVRDERELEELAEQVSREFRTATVYQSRDERGGYRGGWRNGYGQNYRREWR